MLHPLARGKGRHVRMETLIKQRGRIITLTLDIDADAFAEALGLKPHTNGTAKKTPAKKAANKTPAPVKATARVPAKAPVKTTAKVTAKTPAKAVATGRPYRRLTDDYRAKIVAARKANPNITRNDLAELLDVPYHTVVTWLRSMNQKQAV